MEPRIKDRGKVFRDPVHRLIRIEPGDDFILELIDTRVFQRLRRIRQLGVSSLTYHGAEHSRFSHSMGVFNFAQRILRSLQDRYKQNSNVVDYLESHARELKAAALLHDIGHGPFSHLLERAFRGSPDHEDTTIKLIRDPDGEIATILDHANIDPEKVAEIIGKTSNHWLMVDIVSSQLDSDRMDYLLRDSLHSGVEYGRYDSEWIVRNLCIGQDPGAPFSPVGEDEFSRHRLCLDRERGLHSAEQLILARLHMTMQVYMHRVTRGYEMLLLNLFRLAGQLADDKQLPPDTPGVIRRYFEASGDLTHEDWLRFDEPVVFAALAVWAAEGNGSHADLRTMAQAFLNRQKIYKARPVDRDRLGLAGWQELSSQLQKIGRPGIDWALDEGEVMPYKGLLYAASRPRADGEEQSAESILLSSGDVQDRAVPVDTESRVFQILDFKGQTVCRVYYDHNKAGGIEPILDRSGVKEER